jgi:hypothetical protein
MNHVWILLDLDANWVMGVFKTREAARSAKRYLYDSSKSERADIFKQTILT